MLQTQGSAQHLQPVMQVASSKLAQTGFHQLPHSREVMHRHHLSAEHTTSAGQVGPPAPESASTMCGKGQVWRTEAYGALPPWLPTFANHPF